MSASEDAKYLERFIQNIYLGESISHEESDKNLENGLIEIKYFNGQHKANGLLISPTGYFLTANHAADDSSLNVIEFRGKRFPITKVCRRNEQEDVALVKANMNVTGLDITYRIKNTNAMIKESMLGYPVEIKSRMNGIVNYKLGKMYLTEGTVNMNSKNHSNLFLIDIPTDFGESGGLLLSLSGRLMGFVSSGSRDSEDILKTGCSKIFSGFDLVQEEINYLKRPLTKFFGYFK